MSGEQTGQSVLRSGKRALAGLSALPARLARHRLLSTALLLATLAFTMGAGDGDARFNRLGHELMCMCGCNQILLECNHVGCPYSDRMRQELAAAVERGDNNNLILQGFVQKYGAAVLAAPTTTGFNRVAWIMPFAVFVLAVAGVAVLVVMWRRRSLATAPAGPAMTAEQLTGFRERARKETEF